MARFFLILCAIAVLVWLGQSYFAQHPAGNKFWNAVGDPSTSYYSQPRAATPPEADATPPDQTINGCRVSLQEQAQKALMPLEDSKDFSAPSAMRSLQETQRDLAQFRSDPDYTRLMQASMLLGQALQERQGYAERLARDKPSAASSASSDLQTSRLQTSRDLTPLATASSGSSNFFMQRVLTEWRERSAQYRPAIGNLLVPSNQ